MNVLNFFFVYIFNKKLLMLQCENSWVQLQLKNHPDELWEDGMNDYIAHTSNILVSTPIT